MFDVRLIHPSLVPGADLRMFADARSDHGQFAVSPLVQHFRTMDDESMK